MMESSRSAFLHGTTNSHLLPVLGLILSRVHMKVTEKPYRYGVHDVEKYEKYINKTARGNTIGFK